MLTFKAIGLQRCILQQRKQLLEKKNNSVLVRPCQAKSNDDLEHTETLGTIFIYSMQTENRQSLQLNTLQKYNFLLPPLEWENLKKGRKYLWISFFPIPPRDI